MEAFIIYGYKLTEKEVVSLPVDVLETWVEKGWLIGSDTSTNWYFARQVINTDERIDLEIKPENFFSPSTNREEFEQQNMKFRAFYKFFSGKQLNYYLILREPDNYYDDIHIMQEIRDAGTV